MLSNSDPPDRTARDVCHKYPALQGGFELHPLGNHGGFSGARLWRVKTFAGEYCLKAWPQSEQTTRNRVRWVHEMQSQAIDCRLSFIPRLILTRSAGAPTSVFAADQHWELSTWQPGKADFHERPGRIRLRAAMESLARLHTVWQTHARKRKHPEAVTRRIDRLTSWAKPQLEKVRQALGQASCPRLYELSSRAFDQFKRWQPIAALSVFSERSQLLQVQPCLCDVWHDHVLFEQHRVTGIVDYGSMRVDSVTADLARLLGSLLRDDREQKALGIGFYASVRELTEKERQLVGLLDWTGVVVGAGNWLRWLYLENRTFENTDGVIRRLSELVTRMESWQRPGIVT
jgi:Ser/Thr protein kinase RdoA (MazF antagonist)